MLQIEQILEEEMSCIWDLLNLKFHITYDYVELWNFGEALDIIYI